jgi:hypothetical protein
MKVIVKKPVEIDIAAVQINVPVNYGEEDIPNDFPFRDGDQWSVIIDMDTGKIMDWPEGIAHDLHMKVVDGGSYYLLDRDGNVIAKREQEYVPDCIPGKYGDYIDLGIRADGVIANWNPKPDVSEFFGD